MSPGLRYIFPFPVGRALARAAVLGGFVALGCTATSPASPTPREASERAKGDAAACPSDYLGDGEYCDCQCATRDPDCDTGLPSWTTCDGAGAPECPDPTDPAVHYVAGSDVTPSVCATVRFGCEPDQTQFSGDCGCGCIDQPEAECPARDDPKVHWVDDGDPARCQVILFGCPEGQSLFTNPCGCGCIEPAEAECPARDDPKVHWVDDGDPARCQVILFGCPEGQSLFTNPCGCGCVEP